MPSISMQRSAPIAQAAENTLQTQNSRLLFREAKKAALQASLADKEAAERAGHNYKAKPVPTHIHHPTMPALPEPSFTVSRQPGT